MHSYKNNISLRKESNMGVASLVLGIASLVCGCFLPGLQWIGSITGPDWHHSRCAWPQEQ